MATSPIKRAVKTPGATTPESTEQPPEDTTEDTTSTVSEPVESSTGEYDSAPDPTVQPEIEKALPDDYEEFLAWKNSRAKQADEPVTPVATTTSMGAVNGIKRKRPVLGPKGWTQEEY